MQIIEDEDDAPDNVEQLVWDALKKDGKVGLKSGDVIVGLLYYRYSGKENFFAGYALDDGGGCECMNIPVAELSKIVPKEVVDIEWNAAEAVHCPNGPYSKKAFTDAEMKIIDDAFRNAGFEIEIEG